MGNFSTVTGIVTMFMFLFVSHNVIRRAGWRIAALLTPVALLVTGILFIGFMLFRHDLAPTLAAFGTTPLMMAVLMGATQNILSKSTKYSLFDPTKEMTYIPLDDDSKVRGKAAIDSVGARLGKSGGSLVLQVLMPFVGSIAMLAPAVGLIIVLSTSAWIFAVNRLAPLYEKMVAEK
jgi:AAA family ATP:ADP antiporter